MTFESQHVKELVVGKEYVFANHSEIGFRPTGFVENHGRRYTIASVGKNSVKVAGKNGNWDKRGFFEIETAKKLYRETLKKRQATGYPQSDETINALVAAL